jgi:hypothetical protein
MFERVNARMLPLANRTADLAAAAPACCNACRTCATTNIVMVVVGSAVALGGAIAAFARRFVRAT